MRDKYDYTRCGHWHTHQFDFAKTMGAQEWKSKVKYNIGANYEKGELNEKYMYDVIPWPPHMPKFKEGCRFEDPKGCPIKYCRAWHERQLYFKSSPGASNWICDEHTLVDMKKSHREYRGGV